MEMNTPKLEPGLDWIIFLERMWMYQKKFNDYRGSIYLVPNKK